ncbi:MULTISPECIES: type II toxin-antitoxin system antitoxin SocA domain-containing protein [unclassified Rhizobium]|uniref:Panacea domain-containing protein n=1 Tax=unclassified Rhizobium TaxID=2613769 RepID=UPI0006F3A020|nr:MULTISPECIES: type II toxin-antitoxin system antitoxin SocA domain-containing protein [unclassified Rhizobium]KQV38503.1 hypothetical protein ASC86_09885 [Rhizobium sp. Root1212]KRD31156.1 hypothetical protein ASE37_09880 [Rhizobium sp. Root268]
MAYDPRTIANIVLDIAESKGVKITNLSLNKILYFMHAWYLAKNQKPLIEAKIEAWDYGPVIREVYSEFKHLGANEINSRAYRFDVDKLKKVLCEDHISNSDLLFIGDQFSRYGHLSAGKLVSLSHEQGGPWDVAYNRSGRVNPGMEISNELIQTYFDQQTRH